MGKIKAKVWIDRIKDGAYQILFTEEDEIKYGSKLFGLDESEVDIIIKY